ncbi:hypothetical protein ACPXCO_34120 [Streptomyces cyaneofuscatus]|uniref:hypothetical protein n=1 Tax=Streptomyces TaxID=1883 RepID=UPI001AF059CC|nr:MULTISPECIES: hypothetical protein [unclassified Streptomyces]CAD5964187.1 conserved protein of unknown function [Streptomyces sp. KY75]CAD5978515.1 conserved protein of unknown function [Streptomyces sp. KY70]
MSVVGASGAWFLAEPLALRGLVAAVAAAALTGAYLMRSWDRAAGLQVAELTRARTRDEWRAEERIAELEQDLEESRELRTRLETKLRRKRVELAGLRGEHAGLLRRYANAETERASALEGRRQLAIEAAATPAELPAGRSTPTPEAYGRADEALLNLTRNAALQEARRAEATARAIAGDQGVDGEGPQGKDAAAPGAGEHHQHRRPSTTPPAPAAKSPGAKAPDAPAAESLAAPAAGPEATGVPVMKAPAPAAPAPLTPASPAAKPQVLGARPQPPALGARTPASAAPVHVPRTVPAASAVVPYAAARRHLVPQGSFDFFGTQNAQKANAAIESVQNEDLADVVGEEALAVHRTGAVQNRAVGKVIDLTAHDETEQIDVAELRGAVS